MKKIAKILITAAFAVGFGSLANAQSASISANATVISEIAVTTQANLNFGTVVVGQTKSVYGFGNIEVSTGPTLGSANLGVFLIEAQRGSNVRLTFVLPTNLSKTDGALLPISFAEGPSGHFGLVVRAPGDELDFDPRNPYQINNFLNGAEPEERFVQVKIGGVVNATGVTPGSYTGTIMLNATYN